MTTDSNESIDFPPPTPNEEDNEVLTPSIPQEEETQTFFDDASFTVPKSSLSSANAKLPRGVHAPPPGAISFSNQFLWDHDDPISPPESSSRSINFDQLGSSHGGNRRIEFPFLNEDDELYFNRGTRRTSRSINDDPFPRVSHRGPYETMSLSNSPLPVRNIAPKGLGEYDYHVGTISEDHYGWIERAWSDSTWMERVWSDNGWIQRGWSKFADWMVRIFYPLAGFCGRFRVAILFTLTATLLVSSTVWHDAVVRDGNVNEATVPTTLMDDDDDVGRLEWNRTEQIIQRFVDREISSHGAFQDTSSPQYAALMWIVGVDPLQVDPWNDAIDGRYACAVLYMSVDSWDEELGNPYNETWLSGRGLCEWHGIVCSIDGSNEEPLGTDMKNTSITNPQPKVNTLHFDGGAIRGPLVTEILVAFQNLEVLRMSGVHLQGNLPSQISLLTELQVLSLGNNELTGPIPIELLHLRELRLLGLFNNNFSSSIPQEIGNLTQLSVLYLDSNALTGTIPATVQSLHNLVDLRFRNNFLNGTLPRHFPAELKLLYLDRNQFTGSIPSEIGSLTHLQSLHLYSNNFVSSLPPEIGNLQNLVTLIADHNRFSGEIPAEFIQLTKLKYLWLTNNMLTGSVPDQICGNEDIHVGVDCDELRCACCDSCP